MRMNEYWNPFYKKMRYVVVLLVIGWFLLVPIAQVSYAKTATSPIQMLADVGFQTFYDPREWTPIRISFFNGTARAVNGNLVMPIADNKAYPYAGTFHWSVRIPIGTSTMTLGLPGALLVKGQVATLYVQGQAMTSIRISGVPVNNAEIAGVISDHQDAIQFLAGVSSVQNTSQLVAAYVPPDQVPVKATLLSGLSYLYVDGKSATLLSQQQIVAILRWVQLGGVLILGGLEPNAGQVGGFVAASPVSGKIVVDGSGQSLANWLGMNTPPGGTVPLLYGAATSKATVLIGSRSQAILATSSYGRGQVAYLGVQADSSSMVSWVGNASFWNALLPLLDRQDLSTRSDLFGQNGLWTMMNAAELFPQIKMPPLWIFAVIFIIYVLMAGPLLYVFLRKMRKNELAWIFLPGLSIVFAVVIYLSGNAGRPNGILSQNVGLVDIVDPHLASIVAMQALMSPQMRSYEEIALPNSWLVPLSDRVSTSLAQSNLTSLIGVSPTISFQKVRAWGGRFAYAMRNVQHFGALSGQLFTSSHSIGGYVTNTTKADFSNLALLINGHAYPLGALRSGASLNVSVLVKSMSKSTFDTDLANAFSSATHGVGRSLYAYLLTYAHAEIPKGYVMVIGWTHEDPNVFLPQKIKIPAESQWIVRQLMPLTKVVQ